MFYHNFIYTLKILFRNKALIFWTYIFPILLGTLFNLAFSNIEKSEMLDVININIVNDNKDLVVTKAIDNLSKDDDNKLFNTEYVSMETAKDNLSKGSISGYITFSNTGKPSIYVSKNGINETIIKYVIDEIESNKNIINDVIKDNNGTVNVNEILNIDTIKLNNITRGNISYTMIEYYSLIAMACMYGALLSITVINRVLPNISSVGKRVSSSMISKSKLILSSILSCYLVELIGISLLYVYMLLVLKVDFGSNFIYVVITSLLGILAGISFGVMIGSTLKVGENAKTGILIAYSMTGSLFAGMMGVSTKYVIDKNVGILNNINPVNMITDAIYSLYYYGIGNRYYFDILSLGIFSLVMIVISILVLRRVRYDSI